MPKPAGDVEGGSPAEIYGFWGFFPTFVSDGKATGYKKIKIKIKKKEVLRGLPPHRQAEQKSVWSEKNRENYDFLK